MIPEFNRLSTEETDIMFKAPFLIIILIAGADDKIDKHEMKQAIVISKLKLKRARRELVEYYNIAGQDFEDKLKIFIHDLPKDTDERNEEISKELAKLNDIFPKLDKKFSVNFYESMKDMAVKIAESSGGVFGFMSVGYEESKVVDLKMIREPK